jgi:hypothetical protein
VNNIHKAKTHNISNMCSILNKLEDIYNNNLVYRTIVVCYDTDKYKKILNMNNYDVFIIDKYDNNIEYEALDVRILLIDHTIFIDFISRYYNKETVSIPFYSLILFDICEQTNNNLKIQYKNISKNNTQLI